MNAEEAREKALSVSYGKMKDQYNDVHKRIDTAVLSGKFHASYYEPLLEGVKLKLEGEGYDVKTFSDQRDGTTITISW